MGEQLGPFLRELRERLGLTLREVESMTDGLISNAYLSQLENGQRTGPNPRILVALAAVYGVPATLLFEKAEYIGEPPRSSIDVAFEQVRADPTFQFGTRFQGDLDQESKRVIIELYEQATKKTLLPRDPPV